MQSRPKQEILNDLSDALSHKIEQAAIVAYDELLANYEESIILKCLSTIERISTNSEASSKARVKSTILIYAIKVGFNRLAALLINRGYLLHETTQSESRSKNGITPLRQALWKNNIEIATLLLAHGVDVLEKWDLASTLVSAQSPEMLELLLNHAKSKDVLKKLVSAKFHNITIFSLYSQFNKPILLKKLLSSITIPEFTSVTELRAMIRETSFTHGDSYFEFSDIAAELGKRYPEHIPKPGKIYDKSDIANFNESLDVKTIQQYYEELFGAQAISSNTRINKQQATKNAIAEFCAILQNPRFCIQYLESMNREFRQYYDSLGTNEPFPEVQADAIKFYKIHHAAYPVPLSTAYTSKIKHNWFKQFLIHKLRSNGLAERIFKWQGTVPGTSANDMLKNGNAMFENRYFPKILFHGRDAHMIQYCLLLAAIMNGDIKVNYTQDDQIHQLQAREMIDAMLEMNKDGASIWAYILDLQAEFFTFSDPYLLTSFIMVNGYTGSFDIREISDALIDDTLKSTLKLHQIFKQHIPRLLNPECFILQLNEIPLTHHFVPEFLINQVVDTHQQPSSKHHGFFHSFNHSNNAYSYYEQQVATAPACAP